MTTYVNEGIDARAEVLFGRADSLRMYIKRNGALIAPDANSVYVTITDPSGSVVVARTQTGVTSSAAGLLSFSRTWDTPTFERWEDYKADWEWMETDVISTDVQFFDVVKTKLPCLLDASDLQEFYPDIEEHLKSLETTTDITKFIRQGWRHLLDRIRSGGSRPSLILDRVRLIGPGTHIALMFACNALSKATGDLWDTRSTKHDAWYKEGMAGLGELKYDRDEDGLASEGEVKVMNRRRFSV